MNRIEITKTAVNFVVGAGVTKIVRTVIRNNVQPQTVIDQITVAAGSVVLGGIAADASKVYTDAKIEEIAAWWKKNVNKTTK